MAEEEIGEISKLREKECIICLENKRSILLLPCKHLCLCSMCAKQGFKIGSKCPIDRGSMYLSFIYIIFSYNIPCQY